MLTGHSQGGFIISKAIQNLPFRDNIRGTLFAIPYGIIGKIKSVDDIYKNKAFRKVFYLQDVVSNKAVEYNDRKNTIVLNDPKLSPLESHSIKSFTAMSINDFVIKTVTV